LAKISGGVTAAGFIYLPPGAMKRLFLFILTL
jgi:hypothetical protein